MSLRDCIRSGVDDQQLVKVISEAVKRKHAQHAGNSRYIAIAMFCIAIHRACMYLLSQFDFVGHLVCIIVRLH